MTTESPESGTTPRSPSRIRQDNAKSQLPYVDPVVVGLRPPCRRHGQIASQLHASKYDPESRQSPITVPRPDRLQFRHSVSIQRHCNPRILAARPLNRSFWTPTKIGPNGPSDQPAEV